MAFYANIEKLTLENNHYRKVIDTNEYQQLALMSLAHLEDIPVEVHEGSQFIRVEEGKGLAIVGNKKILLKDGVSLVIPPGKKHYIKNTANCGHLKMYTIYSPPEHKPGTVMRRQCNCKPRSKKSKKSKKPKSKKSKKSKK